MSGGPDTDGDIAVLIVDDQPEVRLLLRRIIEASGPGLHVSGEAASGREAVELAERLDPAVIVLDERMPDMDGIQTALQIREHRADQPIILCSAYVDPQLEHRAHAAGISACLDKGGLRTVPHTIRLVAQRVGGPPTGGPPGPS